MKVLGLVSATRKIVENYHMRLDHISYVTSHEQLSDTVQRMGSRLGGTFVDGGIHPRFGTRNFTSALKNDQYIEIVCPLDHPATEQTPWGKAVANKANEGGGWFTWIFSTTDINPIARKFGREAVDGHRTRPNGSDLMWKQIGIKEIAETKEFPFFIEWLSTDHPSQEGTQLAEIKKIVIASKAELSDSWFKSEILDSLGNVTIEWVDPSTNEGQSGIVAVHLSSPTGDIVLD